jgi:hypothetical protein
VNELIRKFERESGIELYGLGLDRAKWQDKLEKFAELIVRECASIYDKIDNGNQHLGTDDYLEALQKHFRVEE